MSPPTAAAGPMPPFHIYREFLAPDDCTALTAWAIAHEACFAPSKVVGDRYDPDRRTSVSLQKSAPSSWRDNIVARVEALVPALFADTHVEPFEIGLKELEMVAYNDGAHFKPHIDTLTGEARHERGDRVLSGVYYFHREPRGFSGGTLRLYRFGATDEGDFIEIPPEQNSFVLFPSWTRHEVREIACPSGAFADSRFAVNCWLYRAPSRPA